MNITTPKDWENMELIEAETAYGNKVMIPKAYMDGWEGQRQRWIYMKKLNKEKELIELLNTCNNPFRDMAKVFHEIYQE